MSTALVVIAIFGLVYHPDLGVVGLAGISSDTTLAARTVAAMHFSAITFTTVGYGNIYPTEWVGQLLTAFEAMIGVVLVGQFLFSLGRSLGPR